MRIASILIILASMIPLFAVDATDYKKVQAGATGTLVGWGIGNVPTGLTGITAIAKSPRIYGSSSDSSGNILVLKEDGTLLANWRHRITGVIAIGGNAEWVYALKADGTVFQIGCGDSCIEDPLTNIAQVDAKAGSPNCPLITYRKQDGSIYSKTCSGHTGGPIITWIGPTISDVKQLIYGAALLTNGIVMSWEYDSSLNYTQPIPLPGLSSIVTISDSYALKSDGTVWGLNGSKIAGLSEVISISQNLALKKDGTVIVWGNSTSPSNLPTGLTGVKAIAGNSTSGLAIMDTPIVVQPASIVTPNPTIGPGGVLTITQVLRNTLSIGVTENYLASPPPGFTLIPGSCTSTIGGCVIESTPTSSLNQTGLARRSLDQSQLNSQTLTWSGVIPGNGTVTITYQIRVGTLTGGSRQVCLTPTLGGAPATPTCVMVAPLSGPGNVPLAAGLPQKPGSVMIYNAYTSSANTALSETQITLTNTNPVDAATVHLFFVDGATCTVADQIVTLTQSQTASFQASDVDPGVTGYLIAVAVDQNGCPTINNYLIGRSIVRFESGHHASLPAIGVSRLQVQGLSCTSDSVTATLAFNGVEYDELPRALAIDSLPSLATGNSPLLIVNRLGGNLTNGAERLGTLAGLLFDDSEVSRSFMLNGGECQVRGLIGNNYPRTVPRYTTVIPAGRTGWMKFWANGDEAITGAMINEAPTGLSGGHNLHALTTTASATLTIPVIPAS